MRNVFQSIRRRLKQAKTLLSRALHLPMPTVSEERPGANASADTGIALYLSLSHDKKKIVAPFLPYSNSQFAQDLFVISESAEESFPAFFVEFGATDGIRFSNSFILEKLLGWQGILAEPAISYHKELARNRNCKIDHRCIYHVGGLELDFHEVTHGQVASPELSTLAEYSGQEDWAKEIRAKNYTRYKVKTASITQLLEDHNSPQDIGYLSIDTEGGELEILKSIDYSRYNIRIITVEHNSSPSKRNDIYQLLFSNGYHRLHESISGPDDWYVRKPLQGKS